MLLPTFLMHSDHGDVRGTRAQRNAIIPSSNTYSGFLFISGVVSTDLLWVWTSNLEISLCPIAMHLSHPVPLVFASYFVASSVVI